MSRLFAQDHTMRGAVPASSPAVPAGGAPGVPLLMYHSIAAGAARRFRRFAVDPGEFAAQMDYLAAEGYHPVTAADFARSHPAGGGATLPARPVVLTFDDAYADFYSAALPVLRDHSFPATLYVPTAYVGSSARWMGSMGEGDRPILSWPALREVWAEGVEISAHGHAHSQLDRVPAALARYDVHLSRRLLQDNLGSRPEGFAYPFGYWNRTARAAVAAAGFRYAVVVDDLMAAPQDDVLTLPRLTVNAGIGVTGLARLLARWPSPGRRTTVAAKRVTWRALRQGIRVVGGDPREGAPA